MDLISVTYELKYYLKSDKHIRFTADLKMCFNKKNSKEITTSNNFRKGFWVKRKFYRLDQLDGLIELIPKYNYSEDELLSCL